MSWKCHVQPFSSSEPLKEPKEAPEWPVLLKNWGEQGLSVQLGERLFDSLALNRLWTILLALVWLCVNITVYLIAFLSLWFRTACMWEFFPELTECTRYLGSLFGTFAESLMSSLQKLPQGSFPSETENIFYLGESGKGKKKRWHLIKLALFFNLAFLHVCGLPSTG